MEKFTNEELLEVLHPQLRETKELTTKQKVVLGQLIIYNGLDKKNSEGYFFRSNKDLTNDCDIQEKTLITAINKLVMLGFIDTVRGTRKDNRASLYRINQKTIDDYCKTLVKDYSKKDNEDYSNRESENYSNDYSKILTAMHVRITELELTVKTLADRITVIEGRNYSTDKDKEIELDKEIDSLNNNILNNNSFQELETVDSESSNLTESQQIVTNEIPMEVLISTNELDSLNDHTDADKSSTINEGTNDDEVINTDEESYVPTTEELEIWKGCLNIMNPYLSKMQTVTSRMIVDGIKDEIVSKAINYFNSIDGVTDWVRWEFSKRVADYTHARYDELEELNKKQREKQLQQSSRYADFY